MAANPLDYLFKLSTQRKVPAPVFEQVCEQGPPHMKTFAWRCTFMDITAEGQGRSKKEAKSAAAKAIASSLDLSTLPQPPSFQAVMEKKRKKSEQDGDGDVKKSKKHYDYSRHFHLYGNCGAPPTGPYVPYGYNFPMPMLMPRQHRRVRLNVDDHHVITKHKSIYPKEEELETILQLVRHTEEGLKKTSDAISGEETPADEREIMGVARVGELAKGLLLSGDRAVNVVVVCKSKPTIELLGQVHTEMQKVMKEMDEQYQLHMFEEEGGFCVVKESSELPYAVNVSLTSTKIRKGDEEEGDEETKETKETEKKGGEEEKKEEEKVEEKIKEKEKQTPDDDIDPPTMLPRDKCEQALAELRHSKWFQVQAAHLPSCVECIRILKEMSNRDPSWNPLSDWAIELLVEKSLFSYGEPMTPSFSLLRVLEVVASGIFMVDGPGLCDPCEREPVDAAAELTTQQREDLTSSAQQLVRMIHFRKIHLVLGMDRLPPKDHKNGKEKTEKPEDKEKEAATEVVEK